jgi:hypothetical protein
MPRPLKRPEQPIDPYKAQALPVGRPAAVYYRQSSEAQIGNISTTLQTIDMIEHLMHHGWVRENIHMIDMDAGVSGSKKIRERKGMSLLYDLIESGQLGLVAAQDVDRFFRDVTMIENMTSCGLSLVDLALRTYHGRPKASAMCRPCPIGSNKSNGMPFSAYSRVR